MSTFEANILEHLKCREVPDPLDEAPGGKANVEEAETMVRKSKLQQRFEKAAMCSAHRSGAVKVSLKKTEKYKKLMKKGKKAKK